ncbi:NAD-dependent epimerase/dehydratase family protein [Nakamurella deserti]|uniref:NAD-dependent epimerase/dehydratase family protein n=1 Tax=Nakamurella deserti TaxID=2164074 RepID=UPI000DBE689E|nr:NAD-dependent epimerase/dehydratase family protein [Nakamurella deserti]
MALHVVLGAGPVGTAIAEDLLTRGETVRVLTRRGTGPDGTERIALDVTDVDALVRNTAGAAVIYNAVNPPYDRWTTDWPPLAAAMLTAAEAAGAVLAVVDNLYPYGPVDGPMSAALPDRPSSVKGAVRQRMWEDALAAAAAGRIRAAVAVRGSDYVGPGPSLLTILIMDKLRAGRTALVPADLDAPHAWTNPADAGRLLVAAVLDPRGWNRYWLVPGPPAVSLRELVDRAARIEHTPAPRLRSMPVWMLRLAGLFDRTVRELVEMNYQFRRPFTLDTADTVAVFGDHHTPLDEGIRQTLGSPAGNWTVTRAY